MSTVFILTLVAFFGLALVGMPVAFAMFVASIGYLFVTGRDLGLFGEQILNGLYDSFVLLAVPLFILAANIMNASGVSDRLFEFCQALVGRFRGGLAQVDILVSIIFSGMSGSAIADAAGPGKLVTQMMIKQGRIPPGFAASVAASSATIGPIIPPSIPMVIYAVVSDTSVGYLFLGGVIPGPHHGSGADGAGRLRRPKREFPEGRGDALARTSTHDRARRPGAADARDPALLHLWRRDDADRGSRHRGRLRACARRSALPRTLLEGRLQGLRGIAQARRASSPC